MSKYLLNVVETYRVDTEEESEELINEAKSDGSFELTKYNCEHKEKKSKGEIIDEAYVVLRIHSSSRRRMLRTLSVSAL